MESGFVTATGWKEIARMTPNDYDRVLLWTPQTSGLRCRPTSASEVRDLDLKARLLRTCVKYGGVGVAAPQIGIEIKAVLINYSETTRLMINPHILELGKEGSRYYEGCLSLPLCTGGRGNHKTYQGGKVWREDRVIIGYEAEDGEGKIEEFTEFIAHIAQHELDHLEGKFYIDHIGPLERETVMRKFRRFKTRFEVKLAETTP
jgi:peptide deformylase